MKNFYSDTVFLILNELRNNRVIKLDGEYGKDYDIHFFFLKDDKIVHYQPKINCYCYITEADFVLFAFGKKCNDKERNYYIDPHDVGDGYEYQIIDENLSIHKRENIIPDNARLVDTIYWDYYQNWIGRIEQKDITA